MTRIINAEELEKWVKENVKQEQMSTLDDVISFFGIFDFISSNAIEVEEIDPQEIRYYDCSHYRITVKEKDKIGSIFIAKKG